jgi:hypothetical protein
MMVCLLGGGLLVAPSANAARTARFPGPSEELPEEEHPRQEVTSRFATAQGNGRAGRRSKTAASTLPLPRFSAARGGYGARLSDDPTREYDFRFGLGAPLRI